VTEGWRKLHNEELHNLYSSPSIIRKIKDDEKDRAYRINEGEDDGIWDIGGKARRKETTRKTKTWVGDNIKMDLREIGWDGVDWIGLAHDRDQWRALVNTVMKLRVP
jgi:hypothetical protein